ncbi:MULTISPECIES: glycosyltransferase family 2 protein [Priestia]|uniref:glycosyltransferase family 2 protein n=1 Tax=Priestia TaxID=2800373 RepID=UPI0015E2A321|nr:MULTISPECIES: glycosyltransferase [Priestia]
MQQKISIIVPIYNVKDYLPDTFQSIVKQSIGFNNLEVLLIDDGSTDGSTELIESWTREYTNVKAIYLPSPSGASGKPRNIGITYATGKYTMFADPDDLLLSDSCRQLYDLAEKYNSDIVMGTFETFTSNGFFQHDIFKKELTSLIINTKIEDHPALLKAPFNLMTKIYKTSFIKDNQLTFLERVAAQDSAFSTEAFLLANRITFTPTIIFNYRMRENSLNPSITQQRTYKYFKDFSTVRKEIIIIYKKYAKLNYYDVRYILDLNWLLNQLLLSNITQLEDLREIIEEIHWFILLSKNAPLHLLAPAKQELVLTIVGKNYSMMLPMITNQQKIMKKIFIDSFNKK